MHITIKNLSTIEQQIQSKIAHLNLKNYKPKIIAISKTFKMTHINHLINHGHLHFGENKVQEALEKWLEIKSEKKKIYSPLLIDHPLLLNFDKSSMHPFY